MAWIRPRMPPITSADDAEGICLLSFSSLVIEKLLGSDPNLHGSSTESEIREIET